MSQVPTWVSRVPTWMSRVPTWVRQGPTWVRRGPTWVSRGLTLVQGGRIPRPESVQRVLTTGWSVATTRLVIEPSSKSLRSQTLAGPQICVNRGDRPSCVQWAKLGLSNHASGIRHQVQGGWGGLPPKVPGGSGAATEGCGGPPSKPIRKKVNDPRAEGPEAS